MTADQFGHHLAAVIVWEASTWHKELGGADCGPLFGIGSDSYQTHLLVRALNTLLPSGGQLHKPV